VAGGPIPVCLAAIAESESPTASPTIAPTSVDSETPSASPTIVAPPTSAPLHYIPTPKDKHFDITFAFNREEIANDSTLVAALKNAADRWSAIIIGGFPTDVNIPAGQYCQSAVGTDIRLDNTRRIDDLLIIVDIVNLDGPGRGWAKAGVVSSLTHGIIEIPVINESKTIVRN
jgi:hypothetical protein